jgi:hypothetical protein
MAKDRTGRKQGNKQQPAGREVSFQSLERALAWIINESIFSSMTLHGNTTWTTSQLVVLAVLWVWSDKVSLSH